MLRELSCEACAQVARARRCAQAESRAEHPPLPPKMASSAQRATHADMSCRRSLPPAPYTHASRSLRSCTGGDPVGRLLRQEHRPCHSEL
eukprot:4708353-Alexandrium_andersonii.AAC.1